MPAVNATVDQASLQRVMAQLRGLDKVTNAGIRTASLSIARDLSAGINLGFMRASAPQAHRFANSARPRSDRVPTVRVGGRQREGGFVNGMAVLNAVNYGSSLKRFHTPRDAGGHVIQPTVQRMTPEAFRQWEAAVDRIVRAFNASRATTGGPRG